MKYEICYMDAEMCILLTINTEKVSLRMAIAIAVEHMPEDAVSVNITADEQCAS